MATLYRQVQEPVKIDTRSVFFAYYFGLFIPTHFTNGILSSKIPQCYAVPIFANKMEGINSLQEIKSDFPLKFLVRQTFCGRNK